MKFMTSPTEAIIYENDKLYVCLASYPLTKGHTIVAWNNDVDDIHLLYREEFLSLMEVVDEVRNALLKTLDIEKVYLIYSDEVKHVHWHLVPRYDEKGYNILTHTPEKTSDFSLAQEIKNNLELHLD